MPPLPRYEKNAYSPHSDNLNLKMMPTPTPVEKTPISCLESLRRIAGHLRVLLLDLANHVLD